jgi:hypothetical protein
VDATPRLRLLAAALVGLAGCNELLTEKPESFVAPDSFYRTADDAEAALNAVYGALNDDAGYPDNLWIALDAASDVSRVNPRVPSVEATALGTLEFTPALLRVTAPYGALLRVVTRANTVIARVPSVPMDTVRRSALVGEAKFLRAFAYFTLVRLYGDVPLLVTEADARVEVPRASRDSVYRLVVQDAEDAARVLPAARPAGANTGRATRGAALTLLADVHLTRGEWQRAAGRAGEVVALGTYGLSPNYLNAFLPATENGPEHIFFLPADPGVVAGLGSNFVNYYYPRDIPSGQGGGFAWALPAASHLASYPAGDYRREVSYTTQFPNVATGRVVAVESHVFKWRPTLVTNLSGGNVDYQLYRYAEVLLIEAEALNELGRTAEAVGFLNQVRARARRGTGAESRPQPADYAGPLTQALVREAVLQERKLEFAHEPKRWFDLVRRGEQYFAEQFARNDPEAKVQATRMLWPIPQRELDLNRALTQNPGY